MGRKRFVAGNWKMYKTPPEATAFCESLRSLELPVDSVDVALFPPACDLPAVRDALAQSRIGFGAQNLHPAPEGAFTGEISASMLLTLGCQYVIIGHSERRIHFGESDAFVRQKVDTALAAGLVPVVCVGEQLAEREAGKTETVVRAQIDAVARGREVRGDAIVIAYEPVWAIGTGVVATPEQAQEVHAGIRAWLSEYWGRGADVLRIVYGGSVKPDNAGLLLSQPDIDGALVGGASLDPAAFAEIVKRAV